MTTPSTRKAILQSIAAQQLELFGPSGSIASLFRQVRRGPVRPMSSGWPILNIQDGGQQRQEGNVEAFDGSHDRELKILLVLQLGEVWTRVESSDDWSDRVEQIIESLDAWKLPGAGALRLIYVNDDPADVLFLEGQSAAIWQIEFTVTYMAG